LVRLRVMDHPNPARLPSFEPALLSGGVLDLIEINLVCVECVAKNRGSEVGPTSPQRRELPGVNRRPEVPRDERDFATLQEREQISLYVSARLLQQRRRVARLIAALGLHREREGRAERCDARVGVCGNGRSRESARV